MSNKPVQPFLHRVGVANWQASDSYQDNFLRDSECRSKNVQSRRQQGPSLLPARLVNILVNTNQGLQDVGQDNTIINLIFLWL